MSSTTYPVRVEASLDSPLSRWLWLVKWLLAIPHYIILVFLWLAFAVLSVVALVAILFTGRYPRSIFEFNVGVLRWTWRVQYYAYGALATDRYPPFTLAEVADYPAHLEVAYPARLSRGLVLVKWWLLAIPHYLIVGLFLGGGAWVAWQYGGGLIPALVVIAAVILAFTGRYPQSIYDFVLGMNRWALRVAAYAGLMTDDYPPFRLDMGGHEPSGTLTMPTPPTAGAPTQETSSPPTAAAPAPPPGTRATGWTAGRIASVVVGSVLALGSLGALGAGGTALVVDQAVRDDDGYVSFGTDTFTTSGYAIASDRIRLRGVDSAISGLLGDVRVRVRSADTDAAIFVGIAPTDEADRYLARVQHTVVRNLTDGADRETIRAGGAPSVPPGEAGIWTVEASGLGAQTVTWSVESGDWTVVMMNADGSRAVSVRAQAAATLPALDEVAAGLLIGGVLLLAVAIALIVVPIRRVGRGIQPGRDAPATQ